MKYIDEKPHRASFKNLKDHKTIYKDKKNREKTTNNPKKFKTQVYSTKKQKQLHRTDTAYKTKNQTQKIRQRRMSQAE